LAGQAEYWTAGKIIGQKVSRILDRRAAEYFAEGHQNIGMKGGKVKDKRATARNVHFEQLFKRYGVTYFIHTV
jgi:hypothetical protein